MSDLFLIHYHEIGLKGKNRKRFERILLKNLRSALSSFAFDSLELINGHIVAHCGPSLSEDDKQSAFTLCRKVPGVARVSYAHKVSLQDDAYLTCSAQVLRRALEAVPANSFKVAARRSNTSYHLDSMQLNQVVGSYLCQEFPQLNVKMKSPDITLHVHLIGDEALIYAQSEPGIGGLPIGSSAPLVSLLSTGIDSPVATWQMMRRGAPVIPIHFSGRPQTPPDSEYLVQDIVDQLNQTGGIPCLYLIAFGDFQKEITLSCDERLRVILYRRLMYQVAERIAQIEGAHALVTGESLGQVASQTIQNIAAVDEAVSLPVLRPLIGSDKTEIIARAQEIGTYELSIQSTEDCCTLFMPRKPETHAQLKRVLHEYERIDHKRFVEEMVAQATCIRFDSSTTS